VSAVRVVCFGNALHGDDGFGQHVFARLREPGVLPDGVAAFDAGVAGLNALGYFEGCEKAVVVDALRKGARPGTLHRLVPADLEPSGAELSLHELGVSSLLAALAAIAREPPDVVLIGAEAGELRAFSDRLSPPLAAALPAAVRLIVRECALQHGHHVI
jgi:hydrogenase maturation protease